MNSRQMSSTTLSTNVLLVRLIQILRKVSYWYLPVWLRLLLHFLGKAVGACWLFQVLSISPRVVCLASEVQIPVR